MVVVYESVFEEHCAVEPWSFLMFVYFVHVVLIHVDLKQVLLSWVINIEILVDLHFKEFQI